MSKIYSFETLEPKGVLLWFKKICQIPHGSNFEKPLCDFLANELAKAGCKVTRFKTGAIYATRKATKGYEKVAGTLLQGHTDMVLVQDDGLGMDLIKNPITAYYDTVHKWLKAEGTTLGADNGIGVAMIMEIMTNPKLEHGPLEAVLTTGEETDPSICMKSIPDGIFKSKNIINLDCDKETDIYIGSGAFRSLFVKRKIKNSPIKKGTKTYNIQFKNFTGGHSGLEIHNNHINAVQFLTETLLNFAKNHTINAVELRSGTAQNSIPKFITADVQMLPKDVKSLQEYLKKQLDMYLLMTQYYDKDVTWKMELAPIQAKECVSDATSYNILLALSIIPNGTFNFSTRGKCMFNSSNIGIASISNGYLTFSVCPRSFIDEDADRIREKTITLLKHFGVKDSEMILKDGCSAWLNKDPDHSSLVQLWRKNFVKVYKKQPRIIPDAGGLEIAEIIKKGPQMEANSLAAGPRIWMEHTTAEACPVDTIEKLWKILTMTLKGMKK